MNSSYKNDESMTSVATFFFAFIVLCIDLYKRTKEDSNFAPTYN